MGLMLLRSSEDVRWILEKLSRTEQNSKASLCKLYNHWLLEYVIISLNICLDKETSFRMDKVMNIGYNILVALRILFWRETEI